MTPRGMAAPSRTTRGKVASVRLAGIDAARGLALLGMMATHVLPTFLPDQQLTPTWVGLTLSGRASALFAVLAGIGLALSTGRQQPLEGSELWAARRGIAFRALVVGAVGLSLGGLEVNIAIILVHYAVLFLCVLPFIGLRVKQLLGLAAAWVLLAPVLAYLLRPWLLAATPPLKLGHNPSWEDLSTPGPLLGDLFLTGYYPVLQWIAYLLIGLAIGRLALSKPAVQALLLAGGTVVAVLSKWLSVVLMEDWGGREALQARLVDPSYPLESLLLGRLGEWVELDLLLPLRGAGALTLSLYTAHVWVMAALAEQPLPAGWTAEAVYWVQAAVAVLIGTVFAALGWRGPLEWVAHAANQLGRYQPERIR
ncbi:MAG TPA: heparan-alpha-glucosaminide N-acetyltransferase domain-containing protein [Arthrobacter sp.]|nr:heparan-alpha-glucosaminide N-acetyltransferase domain-containing protein [Arthrobacter sp.]